MRERRYRVHGHVQGVGFRWWTRSQARRLGLTGSVRNCPDGTVLVEARGNDLPLAEFERMLAEGPPGAAVAQVEASEASGIPAGDFAILP